MEISGFNPLDMVSIRVPRGTGKAIDWCCLLHMGGGLLILHQYLHSNSTCADLHTDQNGEKASVNHGSAVLPNHQEHSSSLSSALLSSHVQDSRSWNFTKCRLCLCLKTVGGKKKPSLGENLCGTSDLRPCCCFFLRTGL